MNYTNVKRVGEFFSIANKQESQRMHIDLCEKCAINKKCSTLKALNRRKNIIAPVKQCKTFVPYIVFSVLDGLDEPMFNTMRPYTAWARRLRLGDTVMLYDSLNDQVIGERTVNQIEQGDKQVMLNDHAGNNHYCLYKEFENPAEELEKLLIRSMGKNFYNASNEMSVIYLSK